MSLPSVMKHVFSNIPSTNIPRSVFDRSHGYKTTFNSGYLVPFYIDEALPGDTFKAKCTMFARLSTPIKPIMDNVFLDTFFFAVPYRLVWDHWQAFMGEQDDPDIHIDYLIPELTMDMHGTGGTGTGFPVGSFEDYLGLPTQISYNDVVCSSLYHRAYRLIWNEWFRDQNFQAKLPLGSDPVNPKGDGPDNESFYYQDQVGYFGLENTNLLRRNKRHDYFTSCLPEPQRGPGVDIPIGGHAPVFGTGKALGLTDGTNLAGLKSDPSLVYDLSADENAFNYNIGVGVSPGGAFTPGQSIGVALPTQVTGPDFSATGLYADLDNVTSSQFTINVLREAFQLQKMHERDARGGTRYIEIIRSHFGVISPDARLQRPEYLGGSSQRWMINPVQQTSATVSGQTPQGNLAAFSVCTDTAGFSKSFVEHCLILGFVNVRADLTYQQGKHRLFNRSTREDFYWPEFAHLGEQAVYNEEIYAQGTIDDFTPFGYQERYAEYRYFPSQITGQFRSTFAQPLDIWHLSTEFGTLPVLGDEFIQDNPPIKRIIATPGTTENPLPEILFDSYFQLHCARPMPVYSVPGLIDHF